MTLDPKLGLREWQRLTRCNSKLPLDQIKSRNQFGDRVLDLKSRVHFHKIEILRATALITGNQKFDGSGADIIDRPRGSNGRLPERIAQVIGQVRRGRLLDDFLVAALDRTIALGQPKSAPVLVAKNLDLNMTSPNQITLQQHPIIAKTRSRFALASNQLGLEFSRLADDANPLAATACSGFDEDGPANSLGLLQQKIRSLLVPVVARDERNSGLGHTPLGG